MTVIGVPACTRIFELHREIRLVYSARSQKLVDGTSEFSSRRTVGRPSAPHHFAPASSHRLPPLTTDISTSIVVAAGLRYGCEKKRSARLRAKVSALLETIPILPRDASVGAKYCAIRAAPEAAEQTIGLTDPLIAAHASASRPRRTTSAL